MSVPFIDHYSPTGYSVDGYTWIYTDILNNADGVVLSTIDAYVDGVNVFHGPSTFISPWDGYITQVSVDGYDGYTLGLDYSGLLSPSTLYTVSFSGRDGYGNQMTTADAYFSFRTGVGVTATVDPYEITVTLSFTENMGTTDNDNALTLPTNYVFDNNMYARYVETSGTSVSSVKLWVEKFYGNDFILNISDDIWDAYGNRIPDSWATLTVPSFYSTAHITNYNNKVRTWHDSKYIHADTQRVYLAGTKGIDVVKKIPPNALVLAKWGQIFNSNGINAFYVANIGTNYTFVDTTSPTLANQDPLPGSTAYTTTPIEFSVVDVDTAVEITNVSVYINNILAFRGSTSGWTERFTGYITISYKSLNFTIWPTDSLVILPGTIVSVRVVATDLMDNTLDTSYVYIAVEPTPFTGFGFGSFGHSSFGGV